MEISTHTVCQDTKMQLTNDYFWFRLFKAPGIGPKLLKSIAKILDRQKLEPEMLPRKYSELSAEVPELAKILKDKLRKDIVNISEEYERLKELEVEIIYPGHSDFPLHLLETSPILFTKGQRKFLKSNSVAIAGSRNVSSQGIRFARKLAGDLSREEINIVSGYAKGVDSEAHFGALEAEGTTTIVLPYGIKELHQKKAFKEFDWKRDVLVVSQFDPSAKWFAHNAMIRNKLVCALSKAVVVIESGPERDAQGKMSGTFNTAKTALKMNLPLFVLDPSCLDNPQLGNNALIELGGTSLSNIKGAEQIIECISTNEDELLHNAMQVDNLQLSLEDCMKE